MLPRHAYVHVPFCRHRCGYCDFTLVAGRDDLVERYFAAVARELGRISRAPQSTTDVACLDLDTLYLGGGTPSHLGPAGLRRLFALLHERPQPPDSMRRYTLHGPGSRSGSGPRG
jgi:oxygen-independent coproporphyrinogen-3 oxidase